MRYPIPLASNASAVPAVSCRCLILEELIQIERKARDVGHDRLEPWERKALDDFNKVTEPLRVMVDRPEIQYATRWWKAQPPEKRGQFADWDVREIYAFLSLLAEESEER